MAASHFLYMLIKSEQIFGHKCVTAAEMGKSGQIRDTKTKTGQMGVLGELLFIP